jgi:hypothetical protein
VEAWRMDNDGFDLAETVERIRRWAPELFAER